MNSLLRHPGRLLRYLMHTRFAHFFLVGATGVALNLAVTAFFAELVFGREQYFSAYLLGLGANLLYNFVLHTLVTFKTKGGHLARLAVFMAYSLGMAYLQTQVVKGLVALVGTDWYLLVIGGVILVFSALTFVLFKFVLFKAEQEPGNML